ncbi:two-component system, OmpR family, phosphate regulon sensor histidine kinase PhoR [Parapedobacter indicus]|uniref:histidine kinase n=2 Tax=Parapedobacter indicus TaxID=1477437 RepID=A0A1I3KX89_9SPHI|nr:two-component system phosphate regulon sensor histidine kinase PhoR [Parapedobacter indicus]SFI77077.1 two-component system, OmpR family, phosphate regulon sensor histidine kinase PhoR [Parapedobacter indicus]
MLNAALSFQPYVFLCGMKHKSIGFIIGLMTVALLGVMAMQYFFIRQSYILKAQLFDESVKAALNAVAAKAEKREVMQLADAQRKNKEKLEREQRKLEEQLRIKTEIEQLRKKEARLYATFKQREDILFTQYPVVLPIESNEFYETYLNNSRYKELLRVNFESNATVDGGFQRNDNVVGLYAIRQVPLIKAKDDSIRYFIPLGPIAPGSTELKYAIKVLPPRLDLKLKGEIARKERQLQLLQATTLMDTIAILSGKNPQIVEDFAAEMELYKRPLSQRIDVAYIKSELEKELSSRDINSAFNLEIKDKNTTLYAFANFSDDKLSPQNFYVTELFRSDNERSSGRLSVYFPNKDNILMGNMTVMLFSSIALLLVLLSCFTYTIFTMLRQKKISEMKTDFINNMTHEFKTPVATIMIASESLRDPEIASDQVRAARLANIIYDENVRLGNHIERVLNIARLEKDNLKLEHQDVDMNDLAQAVVDSMELQLLKNDAQVHMHLDAAEAMVVGDELHLSNVLFNLIDNAIKYSQGSPDITIRTKNVHSHIQLTVADKGIGMSRDQLSKIFDQFYRIPTGNLHDVKGFGLGLSYVSDIIKRCGGKVVVKSEKDKGTTFEIMLPLKG